LKRRRRSSTLKKKKKKKGRGRRRCSRTRACSTWRLGLREGVEDEEEVDAVPFPCSDGVEAGHGDSGGRRELRVKPSLTCREGR
jgi:hypothetical protein